MATFEELMAKSRELHASGDSAGATRVAKIALGQRQTATAPQTSGVEQFGSGLNEGLAGFAGFPVDAVTSVLNSMARPPQFTSDVTRGPNGELGVQFGQAEPTAPMISNPVGGSETFRNLLDPVISDVAPQNMAQRYARRTGQELGFGVPAAVTGAAAPALRAQALGNLPAYAGTSVAGDIGSALGGQTAQEIAPGNATADLIMSLIGGAGAGTLAAAATPRNAPTPTLEDIKGQAATKWQDVQKADVRLIPDAEQEYFGGLQSRLITDRATNPNLFPRANATLDDIYGNPNRTLYGLEEDRRLVGRNVAANADEARVGVGMKSEIDDYLRSLDASKVTGGNPEQAVQDAMEARALTAKTKRAEAVLNKEMRGETRAATTGTGGNEVNATRQNIRALFDKERDPTLSGKRQGFTPDEMKAMERVVKGTPGSNMARLVGRLSPTSGALPLMAMGGGGVSGATAAMATGNPLFALPMLGAGVGMVAKSAAENMTQGQIDDLMKTILGGRLTKSSGRNAANAAILQQLLSSSAAGAQ